MQVVRIIKDFDEGEKDEAEWVSRSVCERKSKVSDNSHSPVMLL